MIGRQPDQLVWVYDLVTDEALLPLHVLFDLEVDDRLGSSSTLTFRVRRTDQKSAYLVADQRLRWNGVLYRNTEMTDVRDDNEVYVEVYCEALWYDLQKRVKPGNFPVLGKTPEEGLIEILTNSGWNVGTVPVDATLYSIEQNDSTIVQILRSWAAVTGYELEFVTATQTVNLVDAVGSPIQVPFRYGRNLVGVERLYQPPVATRLYAYGAASLSIAGTNPTGQEFVEDYSWYTDQGLSLVDAQNRHRKDQVWVDERYLLGSNLYAAAVARLARIAQPVISYEMDVVDLSAQLGLVEGGYTVGDTVQVFDDELGLDLSTRIVRTRKVPRQPQRNRVELEYLRPGLTDSDLALDQRAIDYGAIAVLVSENDAVTTLNATQKRWAEIAITVSGVTTPVLGGTLVGTATGTGTLTVQATVDGTAIGVPITADFADGEQVEVSWPTYVADLDEGTYVLDWRAQVTSGTGTVQLNIGAGRAWALVQGAVGVGFATTPNQFVTESLTDFVEVDTGSAGVTAVVDTPISTSVVEQATAYVPIQELEHLETLPFTLDNLVFGQLNGVGVLASPNPEELL